MQGYYAFSVTRAGNRVYVARDGGLTPDVDEADVNSEDVADDLSVWAAQEFDMAFDIGETLDDDAE